MICDYCSDFRTDAESYYVDGKYRIVCFVDKEKLIEKGFEVVSA